MKRIRAAAIVLSVLSVVAVALSEGGAAAQTLVSRAYTAITGEDSPAHVAAEVETGPAPVLHAARLSYARPASIPVVVYHEIDNRCVAVTRQCSAPDVESSSERQVAGDFAWLYSHGFHTVSAAQYVAWAEHDRVALPPKPVLLTDDNGIGNFLLFAQPLLQRYGYTMVAFLVTGFADGASGKCNAPAVIVTDPGCPRADENWDLTWPQLKALSRSYSFGLEAGASGHYVQDYGTSCKVFYACREAGETDAAYEWRVASEQSRGLAELDAKLPGRVSNVMWTVPYSDLGYKRCPQPSCTPQPSDGPRGWLATYAAERYPVVFVEDAFRNGVEHEHFRFDVQGWMTSAYFGRALTADIAAGDFR